MTEQNLTSAKSELRLRFKKASRDYLTAEVNKNIVQFLCQVAPMKARIGAFFALPDEPDLREFFANAEREFAFPRIEGQDLGFYVPAPGAKLQSNAFGVAEPSPEGSKRVELQSLDAILVPAVAFDRRGQRLGRGKGFYDRLLSHYRGLKIGVASVAQIALDDLPTAAHDVAMDLVVTDRYVLRRFDS